MPRAAIGAKRPLTNDCSVLPRIFKDGDEWKDTDQLGTGDLLNAAKLLERAEQFISEHKQIAPRCGAIFYFFFDDLMLSNIFKNSASSASVGLEGGWREVFASDIGLPLIASPRCMPFSPAIAAFLRRAFFR